MQVNLKRQQDINNFSLDILCNQYVSVGSDWNCTNVTNLYSRLYYIESGQGSLSFNGKETLLTPRNIYFIPSGSCFSYHCTDETAMKKLYFHLSLMSSKEQQDIFSYIPKGIYTLSFKDAGIPDIFDIYKKDDCISILQIKSIISNTVVAFYAKYKWDRLEIKKYSAIVLKVMDYIQNNLSINLTVKEISNALFLSESTLSKSFKAETGASVGNYIDSLIFTKAHHLLLNKSLSIKDISHSLGFCDQFYFSRRFKEKFGMPPQQYRKQEILF